MRPDKLQAAPRLLLPAFAVLLMVLAALFPSAARAQGLTPEEAQRLDGARGQITVINVERESQKTSFNGLLELRDRLDPVRDDIKGVVDGVQERLSAARERLAEFGPAPAAGAPPEANDDRKDAQALVDALDRDSRTARALLVQADQLWKELTDARRDLFNSRLFVHQDSFISPSLWGRVVNDGWPDFRRRAEGLWSFNSYVMERRGTWGALGILALCVALIAASTIWLRRRLLLGHQRAVSAASGAPMRSAIAAHAVAVFSMRLAPFAIIALVVWIVVDRFDIAPADFDALIFGTCAAALVYGATTGAVYATFSPGKPQYRLVRMDDEYATRLTRFFDTVLLAYMVGICALGVLQQITAAVSLTIVVTGFTASASLLAGGVSYLMPVRKSPDPGEAGLIGAPVHLLRPIFWLLALAILVTLAFGYIALSSFMVGRALASIAIMCFAAILYVVIDAIFQDALAPGSAGNHRIAHALGVKNETVDLAGTMLAGALRLSMIVLTVLVLLSPWGVEFGNINPFDDVFFGVRFGDLRGWIGAAGIGLILFTAGLAATRMFVGWLEGQLLPRTGINQGVRHSLKTVAGYIGFLIALTIALTQAGVQLQNVALVASALSVGIGFGLQQVVSNFVAGLIVLAERPIRVGDVIVVKGEEGKVQRINVRATELLLGENSTVIVPNSDIVSSIVKNRSFNDYTHRISINLTVALDTDLRNTMQTLTDLASLHPNIVKTPPPKVLVAKVSELGIEIVLNAICDSINAMASTRSDLYVFALEAFRSQGVRLAAANEFSAGRTAEA